MHVLFIVVLILIIYLFIYFHLRIFWNLDTQTQAVSKLISRQSLAGTHGKSCQRGHTPAWPQPLICTAPGSCRENCFSLSFSRSSQELCVHCETLLRLCELSELYALKHI